MKTIYCTIVSDPPRKKSIKIDSNRVQGVSDLRVVRQKLIDSSKTDLMLLTVLKNKVMIFEHVDANGHTCEIEDDDVLEDKKNITVRLFDGIEMEVTSIKQESIDIMDLPVESFPSSFPMSAITTDQNGQDGRVTLITVPGDLFIYLLRNIRSESPLQLMKLFQSSNRIHLPI